MQPNYAGKRPIERLDGKPTPVPWVMGKYNREGIVWKFVDPERADEAGDYRLCVICGEDVDWDSRLYALINERVFSDKRTLRSGLDILIGGVPAPTFGHPRCVLMTVLHCPHFKGAGEHGMVAMTPDGRKMTATELKEYVKNA